jgi:hypothetical protein
MRKRERDTQQNRERERRTAGVLRGGDEVRERDFVGRYAVAHICKDAPNLHIICLRRIIQKERTRRKDNICNVQSISFCRTLKST